MSDENEINEQVATNHDNAVLLLAAAQEMGLPPEVVETTGDGHFRVRQDVVDKAGLNKNESEEKVAKRAEKAQENLAEPQPAGDLDRSNDERNADQRTAKKAAPRAATDTK